MKLSLVSPIKSEIVNIEWLKVETNNGNFVVLPGHAPMITILKTNSEFSYSINGEIITKKIVNGLINIQRESILLLITNE